MGRSLKEIEEMSSVEVEIYLALARELSKFREVRETKRWDFSWRES